jgi:hypothetical protein
MAIFNSDEYWLQNQENLVSAVNFYYFIPQGGWQEFLGDFAQNLHQLYPSFTSNHQAESFADKS